jgi:phage shock protein B
MSGSDGAEVAGAIGLFILVTAVLTMIIWQFGATWRAKAVLAREEEYRKLAEQTASALQETEQELSRMRARLESMERILKEVE